jgi:hypothetical protein
MQGTGLLHSGRQTWILGVCCKFDTASVDTKEKLKQWTDAGECPSTSRWTCLSARDGFTTSLNCVWCHHAASATSRQSARCYGIKHNIFQILSDSRGPLLISPYSVKQARPPSVLLIGTRSTPVHRRAATATLTLTTGRRSSPMPPHHSSACPSHRCTLTLGVRAFSIAASSSRTRVVRPGQNHHYRRLRLPWPLLPSRPTLAAIPIVQGIVKTTLTFTTSVVVRSSAREHFESETSFLAHQVLDVMPKPSFPEHLGLYLDPINLILCLCSDHLSILWCPRSRHVILPSHRIHAHLL